MNTIRLNTFFKFLSKNKLYTAINIFGFAVSLMFVILIADYTVRQLTTDNFHEKADRIYVLGSEQWMGSAYKLSDDLVSRYPEIETICAYAAGDVEIENDKSKATVQTAFVDSCFFDVFSFQLVEGDPNHALASKDNVIVTQSFARKTWGGESPIGKSITFVTPNAEKGIVVRTVSGVMKDISNSVFPETIEMLIRCENITLYNSGINKTGYNNAAGVMLFILAKENADLLSKKGDMRTFFEEFYWPYQNSKETLVTITPLRDILFSPISSFIEINKGSWSFVMILLSVGILILVFAVINYINLTVAQTGIRAKEMATRRLLGAGKNEIMLRFILESILLCFVAFIIAFLLSLLCESYAVDLLQTPISVIGSLTWGRVLIYLAMILLLGVISGIIPASVISLYKPIDTVKGTFKLRSKMVFSKGFLIFQNIITIALIASTITISMQIKHLINAPLGYNYKDIIYISASSGFKNYEQMNTLKEEVSQLACVEAVAMSAGTPLDGGNNSTTPFGPDRMIGFQVISGDSTFFNMLGFQLLRDNNLAGEGIYFNEEALRQMELTEEDQVAKLGADYSWTNYIAGVYKDFQVRTEIGKQFPCMLYNVGDYDSYRAGGSRGYGSSYPWDVLIKVTGDHKSAFDQISKVFDRVTEGGAMQAEYLETTLANSFTKETNLLSITRIFTLIAILISALGLLAMSTFFIQQRRMEIAVRKVFGSTDTQILTKLVFTFVRSVLIAFIISIPVIWIAMDWWLKGYIYKIGLSPIIFILAGIFALIVASLTVFWQSLRASHTNPSEAIRS